MYFINSADSRVSLEGDVLTPRNPIGDLRGTYFGKNNAQVSILSICFYSSQRRYNIVLEARNCPKWVAEGCEGAPTLSIDFTLAMWNKKEKTIKKMDRLMVDRQMT